jgi:hypothetical protein
MAMTPPDDIRSLIAHLVREQINDVVREELAAVTSVAAYAATPSTAAADQPSSTISSSRTTQRGVRVEPVGVTNDADLNSFARRLLHLFENPKNRDDLIQGRLTFRLESHPHASMATPVGAGGPAAHRVDSGVVSERTVTEAARNGTALVVAAGVAITPLAIDKARSLNVHIERDTR